MSDPERWSDGHTDPLVRSLFAAAAAEEPSAELAARVLAPLGVSAATLAATNVSSLAPATGAGTGTTGAGSSGALAASSLPGGLTGTTLAAAWKWAGIMSVGAAVSAGTVAAVQSRSDTSKAAPAPTLAEVKLDAAPLVPSVPPPEVRTTAAPVATLEPTPVGKPEPRKVAAERPPIAASPARATSSSHEEAQRRLGEEAALIDEVRRAIASGDAGTALRKLDSHRRRYPRPLLAPEALYLEMRAQELAPNPTAARKLAERLLATYPNGVHAARARAVLKDRAP